jgi:choline dehydrogenase-like flavoprotein
VLVLEAGSEQARLGFTVRVRGFTVAKRRPPLHSRADLRLTGDPATTVYEELAPGGLSNHWSCAVPRFSEDDFQDAIRAGEEYAWPIGYGDLERWYDAVEPLLQIAGADHGTRQLPAGRISVTRRLGPDWDSVVTSAQEGGRSVLPMPYAYGGTSFYTPSGTSFNAYTRLIAPALRRDALKFRGDSRVVRLEWSPTERRVVAALAVDAGGREQRIACDGVIVAAGAVNSAQILLDSTSADHPQGLGNEHGVLGRYLHDHPLGKLVIDLGRLVSVHRPAYVTRPTLERAEPLLAAAFMQWVGTETLVRSVFRARPGHLREIGFTVFGSMVPRRDDYVARDSTRPAGPTGSKFELALRHPPEIAQLLDQARRQLLEIFERAGWEPRERVWKIEAPGTSVHYGGTCRMHASPRYGVVDAWCRIFGVPNVAVADSAVFTTTPEKNPVLTAMALAARAGDRLARELAGGTA